jgi:hypothetical protein
MRKDLRDIFDQIRLNSYGTNRLTDEKNTHNNNNSTTLLVPRIASDQPQSKLKSIYFMLYKYLEK